MDQNDVKTVAVNHIENLVYTIITDVYTEGIAHEIDPEVIKNVANVVLKKYISNEKIGIKKMPSKKVAELVTKKNEEKTNKGKVKKEGVDEVMLALIMNKLKWVDITDGKKVTNISLGTSDSNGEYYPVMDQDGTISTKWDGIEENDHVPLTEEDKKILRKENLSSCLLD